MGLLLGLLRLVSCYLIPLYRMYGVMRHTSQYDPADPSLLQHGSAPVLSGARVGLLARFCRYFASLSVLVLLEEVASLLPLYRVVATEVQLFFLALGVYLYYLHGSDSAERAVCRVLSEAARVSAKCRRRLGAAGD